MAAMNFLQLCNKLIEKTGISGGDLASVTGQRGESTRAIGWINEAYTNIQELRRDWLWMQGNVSFATTALKGSYTPAECGITDFADWGEHDFRSYLTSAGTLSELFITPMDYTQFRDLYLFGSMRATSGRPLVSAVAPDKSLLLGMAPDAQGYTIIGKYWRTPSDLVLATDIPLLPARFHMLIVYEAMKSYAMYDAATETLAEANRQYDRMLMRLTLDQLPQMGMVGALA